MDDESLGVPGEPAWTTWNDNYLCYVARTPGVRLAWRSKGRPLGSRRTAVVRILESSDAAHGWLNHDLVVKPVR